MSDKLTLSASFVLETPRLLIRPFSMDDLDCVHRILDVELQDAEFGTVRSEIRAQRARWLQWTVMGYEQFSRLHQPPYGERAVVLKPAGQLIGACGLVPCLDRFEQLPLFSASPVASPVELATAEVGLYYAISPVHRRQGYAAEAAQAMLDYAFQELNLRRIIATTTYDNAASIGVMRKLGMRIERNPFPDPPWLQIVGVRENRSTREQKNGGPRGSR
jgi:ribosomal-protein-alanine N-acetyltransferase